MNENVRYAWATALESGRYKQGRGALNRDGACCVLGVLCELAASAGVVQRTEARWDYIKYDDNVAHLPESVRIWAGIELREPEKLMKYNDQDKLGFGELANIVRGL